MLVKFPKTKADVTKLLADIGDAIDRTPDGNFNAKEALRAAGVDFVDNWRENSVWVLMGMAMGVILSWLLR